MALTKILFGGWGAVSVGALQCESSTVQSKPTHCFSREASLTTDAAVDSQGTVWFTDCAVQMCPVNGECSVLPGDWGSPSGIVVDDSNGGTVVYISELGRPGKPYQPEIIAGVKKCTFDGHRLDCEQFGSGWDVPRGLALDHEGNVWVTHDERPDPSGLEVKPGGVWKCSPSADCVQVDNGRGRRNVATDSEGSFYVRGWDLPQDVTDYLEKCSDGVCFDFGPAMMRSPFGLALAVGPDDYVYTMDKSNLVRCSPENSCETQDLGDLDNLGNGNMVVDGNGVLYTVSSQNDCNRIGRPCVKLEVRKISCDRPTSAPALRGASVRV